MPVDPEKLIDHFKIWEVLPRRLIPPSEYKLKDQFHQAEPLQASLDEIVWIANPVKKNDHPTLHDDVHLTGYRLRVEGDGFEPLHEVWIRNQFTGEKWVHWTVQQPGYLLVPASKKADGGDPPDEPKNNKIGHFLCYDVIKPRILRKVVKLEDQFDKMLNKTEDITKLVPIFLGVPVEKDDHRIVHPEAHLAIYRLLEPIQISTADQVSDRKNLHVATCHYLAVPSLKSLRQPKPQKVRTRGAHG